MGHGVETGGDETGGNRRWVGRAPGRIDFMGGAGSYTRSLVLQATTAEGTWASIELRDDGRIVIFNPQACEFGWEARAEFLLADVVSLNTITGDERVRQLVNAAPGIRWTACILGAIFLLKEWFPERVT